MKKYKILKVFKITIDCKIYFQPITTTKQQKKRQQKYQKKRQKKLLHLIFNKVTE